MSSQEPGSFRIILPGSALKFANHDIDYQLQHFNTLPYPQVILFWKFSKTLWELYWDPKWSIMAEDNSRLIQRYYREVVSQNVLCSWIVRSYDHWRKVATVQAFHFIYTSHVCTYSDRECFNLIREISCDFYLLDWQSNDQDSVL